MSTKEKKRCDETCAPFVPSSRRRKVRKSSLERDRRCARKRKRGGVGEKSAPKRPGHNVLLLPAVSLWNDRIQNALSLLRRRPHESTRLVSATSSSPLGQFYRYIIELHSSPDGFPPPKSRAAAPQKSERAKVSSSIVERNTHTHTERAVLKMQFQNKVVLSLSCVGRRTFRIRLRPEIGEGVSSSSSSRALAAAVYKSVVVSSQRRHL